MIYDEQILRDIKQLKRDTVSELDFDSFDGSIQPVNQAKFLSDCFKIAVSGSQVLSKVDIIYKQECSGDIDPSPQCSGACSSHLDLEAHPYVVKKYKSQFLISQDALSADEQLALMLTQIRKDVEFFSIHGDESLPVGKDQLSINNLLGVNDGWMTICKNSNCLKIDAQGSEYSPQMVPRSSSQFLQLLRFNRADSPSFLPKKSGLYDMVLMPKHSTCLVLKDSVSIIGDYDAESDKIRRSVYYSADAVVRSVDECVLIENLGLE